MRTDIPPAAFRLLCVLPVRTHERPEYSRKEEAANHANNVRAVVVDGTQYESLTEAARQLGVSRGVIRLRIERSEGARYADVNTKRIGTWNRQCVMIDGRRYESVAQARALLHIGKATLRKWRKAGRVKVL
jgi:hypothetical protein